jgi:RND family efflux transporter MFP subunit
MTDNADLSKLAIKDKSAPEGNGLDKRILIGGAAVLLLLIYWVLPSSESTESAPRLANESTSTGPAPVQTPQSTAGLFATGYVVAQRQAAVASNATGRLATLNVEEGDRVIKGAVLGELENENFVAVLNQAKAQLESAKTNKQTAEAELFEATRIHERATRLVKLGAIPVAEADTAQARIRKADASLAAALASIKLGEASVERAAVDLGFTKIIAPFDGTVLSKNADVGEIVAPFGAATTARAAIVTIADMSSLEVEADVSESQIQRVKIGQRCEITLDAYPDKRYEGTVNKIVPTVDRAKATVLTRVKFNEIDASVIPEMSAKVRFLE